ncbi:MAG TPA: hypothetical protein VFB04_13875 [Terriglobales bacterium]|nr:hypothetical protein [Terriglobales bacterium]
MLEVQRLTKRFHSVVGYLSLRDLLHCHPKEKSGKAGAMRAIACQAVSDTIRLPKSSLNKVSERIFNKHRILQRYA